MLAPCVEFIGQGRSKGGVMSWVRIGLELLNVNVYLIGNELFKVN